MRVRFELDLVTDAVPFLMSIEEVRYGLKHGFVSRRSVVPWARAMAAAVQQPDPVVDRLVGLGDRPSVELDAVLRVQDMPPSMAEPPPLARTWLFLQLRTLFHEQSAVPDAFEAIEEAYADFGYPPSIESLVRYMPPKPGEAASEDGILARWQRYLADEERALSQEHDRTGGRSPGGQPVRDE